MDTREKDAGSFITAESSPFLLHDTTTLNLEQPSGWCQRLVGASHHGFLVAF